MSYDIPRRSSMYTNYQEAKEHIIICNNELIECIENGFLEQADEWIILKEMWSTLRDDWAFILGIKEV